MVYTYLTGRIGNNLFQIATGSALAYRNNTKFTAIITRTWCEEPDNCFLEDYLKKFQSNLLRNVTLINTKPDEATVFDQVKKKEEIPYDDQICLHGLWQSENYFVEEREHILDLFSMDPKTERFLLQKYEQVFGQEVTSIVIRRGDFIKQPQFHPTCSLKYYRNAISHMGRNRSYLIISDDIDWCRKKFRGQNFYFADNDGPVFDFYLQTLCSHNIISNSTFAWWGAWLNSNPDKTVIAPGNNWFGPFYRNFNRDDLLPDSWVRQPNPLSFRNRFMVLGAIVISTFLPLKHAIEKRLKFHVKILGRKKVRHPHFKP